MRISYLVLFLRKCKAILIFSRELLKHFVVDVATKTGFLLDMISDKEAAVSKEIIIGATTRPLSEAIGSDLKITEYAIISKGESVYISYGSFLAYREAVEELLSLFASDEVNAIDIKKKLWTTTDYTAPIQLTCA